MSSSRHHSSHSSRGGDRSSGHTGSSGSQHYVLPSTAYVPGAPAQQPAPGSAHGSGGSQYSSGASARERLYAQYGRDHGSTPSAGSISLGSQEIPIAYRPSVNAGAQQGAVDPRGSGPSRPSTAGEGPSQGYRSDPRPAPVPGHGQAQPYNPGASTARAYEYQRQMDARGPITFGSESKSAEKARDLKKNPISRFIKRSAEKAKEKLSRKKS